MARYIGEPDVTFVMRMLVTLLAEQEGVDIEYAVKEDGKVTYAGSTKESIFGLKGVNNGKQQETYAG
jgi:hypothetical protein